MRLLYYYAALVIEVRSSDDVEILEEKISVLDRDYDGAEDLEIISDILKDNPPPENGLFKILQYGTINYSQDYFGEWDADINPTELVTTKYTDEQAEEYLKRFT